MIDKPVEQLASDFSLLYWHNGKAHQAAITPEQWRLILPYIQSAVGGTIKCADKPIEGIQRGSE